MRGPSTELFPANDQTVPASSSARPWNARGAARLAWAGSYTIWMCQRALFERALGAPDDRVRELTKEWSVGLRRGADIEVHVTGLDLVDWSQPCVIMCNHQSYLDVLAVYAAMPVPCGFVAKKQLFGVPFFGGVMRALGCVPVDRSNRAEAMTALDEAASEVRSGTKIAIFPEGTRSRGDRVTRLKKGPFYLVQLAGVPVVPVGIRGSAALMPRENTHLESGVIEIAFGPAIPPPGQGPAARAQITKKVRMEIARLAQLPEAD